MAPSRFNPLGWLRRALLKRLLRDGPLRTGPLDTPHHFLHGLALDPSLDFHNLGSQDFENVAWSLDLHTLELMVSPSLLEVTGYTSDSIGTTFDWVLEQILPEDRRGIQHALEQVMAGERPASSQNFRVRFASGQMRWVHVRAVSVDDQHGQPVKLIGSFTDVTVQMHAEEERDRLFNLSLDLLAVGGYGGLLQQLNPAWVRVLGWSRDDLMARPLVDFVHPKDRHLVKRAFERLADGETIDSLESRYQCRDGTFKWLSLSAFPYPERQLIFSVLRDITGKKAVEDQLFEYQDRLRSLTTQLSLVEDRERRALAEAIHDGLAQQLFGIRAKVTLLKYPEKIKNTGQLVTEILEILDETMADARTLSFELFPPVLHEVGLVAALEWLANQFRQRTDLLCTVTEDGRGEELPADLRNMAFQTVRELLANAYKHANPDQVSIFVSHVEDYLTILVEDDGDGFDVRAWQSDRALMSESGGFGLFSIRERLRYIDGRLAIDSAPGQGCRILVSFPRVSGDTSAS